MAEQHKKVLITDAISEEGIAVLRQQADVDVKAGLPEAEIIDIIGNYEALVVRSQTKVTPAIIEAGKKLMVIARAGVGIDNVDLEAATRHGVIVVNAPTGNTVSAAEHAFALMMASARNIPQANTSLKACEWKRNSFMGTELRGKTLGLVGLGNVGSEVAKRARGFEMRVLGVDPLISEESAARLQVELVDLKKLLAESDFISLHIPLTPQTRNIVGAKELAACKPTARIVNCARGGLIDEEALVKAIREKKLAGAAIDVFENEPCTESILFGEDNIIVTPHLGASTAEAQVMAAHDVSVQIVDVFNGRPAHAAVNAPYIPAETLAVLSPYLDLTKALCKILYALCEGQTKTLRLKYAGELAEYDTNALKAAAIGGLLEGLTEERVNIVNCNVIAAKRGLTVIEEKEVSCADYGSLMTIELTTNKGTYVVAGTVRDNDIHVVRVKQFWLDLVPAPGSYFLFSDHLDRPGFIGAIGKLTGDADINISSMHLGRLERRGPALLVLTLDEPMSEADQQKMLEIPDVYSVTLVAL